MATYYSEHYQPLQASLATAATVGHKARPTVAGGRRRTKVATFESYTPVSSDIFKLFKLRSSDVVLGMEIINTDGGTDVPGTLGLRGDGTTTVVDADFFLADLVFETARAQASDGGKITMNVPSVASGTNMLGLSIWEQLGLSADPGLTYDVVAVIGTVDTGAAMAFTVLLDYLAGD